MQFATDWEFKHVTSSPRYPRSNGKAESAVKIFKSLFKKAFKDNRDPWLALLDYRNTPTEGMKSSPTQRLMSRRTRTLLPTATSLLQPKVLEGVNEKIKVKKQKAKYYQDRTARTLPEIEIGQEVRVVPQERNQPWKSGTCVKKLSDRSYLVETSSETLRRNRQSLKPAPSTSSQSLGKQSKPTTPASTKSFEASPPVSKTAAIAPETQTAPQMKSPEVPAAPKVLRTRTRIEKPSSRYQDFVMT